jgi:hypothetical protein
MGKKNGETKKSKTKCGEKCIYLKMSHSPLLYVQIGNYINSGQNDVDQTAQYWVSQK